MNTLSRPSPRARAGWLAHSLALVLGLAAPLAAGEDRDNATPTGWRWYYAISGPELLTHVNAGYRLVDIRIQYTSPLAYTAAFVANTGSHHKTWWLDQDVSPATLAANLTARSARVTALTAWTDSNGNTRFTAAMVANTGAEYLRTLVAYDQTVAGLAALPGAQNVRPVLIRPYVKNGATRYAAVFVDNLGANARTFWHWYGATPAFIQQEIAAHSSRVYDVSDAGNGTYNVVLVQEPSPPKTWYTLAASEQSLVDLMGNTGSRPISLQRVGTVFHAVLINNSNALSTRVGEIMRGMTDGIVGVYLKKVNGPVLASIHGSRIMEPASLMKTLHHVHALKAVELGQASLTESLTYGTVRNGCSFGGTTATNDLEEVLRLMMQQSDNAATDAVRVRFGFAAINATADLLGMNSTELRHVLGCGFPPNDLTLADLGRLHEQVLNGYLGAQRAKFYQLMSASMGGQIDTVLASVATEVGFTPSQLTSFKALMQIRYKGGYYPGSTYVSSWGGLIGLPFRDHGGSMVIQQYVSGAFVNGAAVSANATNAAGTGSAEVLRDEIRAAMLSWQNHVPGYTLGYGLGCPSSNNVIATHFIDRIEPEPNIGTTVYFEIGQMRPNTPSILLLGASRTAWQGVPLPLSLSFLGMGNCALRAAMDTSIATSTDGTGFASVRFDIPFRHELVGNSTYSQYAVVDFGANAGNLITSNGVQMLIGGPRQ